MDWNLVKYWIYLILMILLAINIRGEEVRYDLDQLEQEFHNLFKFGHRQKWILELGRMNSNVRLRLCQYVFDNTFKRAIPELSGTSLVPSTSIGRVNLLFKKIRFNREEMLDTLECKMDTQHYYLHNSGQTPSQPIDTKFHITLSVNEHCHYLLGHEGAFAFIGAEVCGTSWKINNDSAELRATYFVTALSSGKKTSLAKLSPGQAFFLCMNVYQSRFSVVVNVRPENLNALFRSSTFNQLFKTTSATITPNYYNVDILECSVQEIHIEGLLLNNFWLTESLNHGCVYGVDVSETDHGKSAVIQWEVCAAMDII